MPSMKNKEHKKGVQAQVNEDNLRLTNKRLVRKILSLEEQVKEGEYSKAKLEELYKRSESFKAQLIVYKGIVNELLNKLIERRDV